MRINKNNSFYDLILKHIIIEVVIIISISILYIGYGFIDRMFITRENEREEKLHALDTSIKDYNQKILEYKSLLDQLKATGEDKKVVSGLKLSNIESIFSSLSEKFGIYDMKLSFTTVDAKSALHNVSIPVLPTGVKIVGYSFNISGKVQVETDVYNMLYFLETYLPGVIIANKISIDSNLINPTFEKMLRIKRLNMEVKGEWFFLTTD